MAEKHSARNDEPTPAKDPRQVARERELRRQADVVKAVEKAGRDELPKLGGPQE